MDVDTHPVRHLLVAKLQYTGIVFAAFDSLALFGDQIPLIGSAGMAVILCEPSR